MEILFGVVIGIFILMILVALHELGHGLVAKRNGVVVKEFGLGFPPKAWGKKFKNSFLGKNVLFSLNWLPLGGFVRLKGEFDSAKEKGDYGAASYWVKTKILLAGVTINWLIAAVLFSFLALIGMPKILPNQFTVPSDTRIEKSMVKVNLVGEDTPASKAGLEIKDEITKFAGQDIKTSEQLRDLASKNPNKTVALEYVRDGVTKNTNISLVNKDGKGYMGASFAQSENIYATWSAPIVGFGTAVQFTGVTLQGVGQLFVNLANGIVGSFSSNQATKDDASAQLKEAGDSVAGPVGILGIIFPAASQAGFHHLILLTALISLTLAVMNILPLPVFDGGRWLLMTVFRLMKKPLTEEIESHINAIGFLLMMGLVILITFLDIKRF